MVAEELGQREEVIRETAIRALRALGLDCGGDEARRQPGVVEVGLGCRPGQDVILRHSFQDRPGYVIASAEDGGVAAQAAKKGLRALDVQIS